MSDDFFSVKPARSPSADPDAHDDFAHAISLRFGSADLRTARLLPDDLPHHHPPQPPSHPLPPRPPALAPPQQPFSAVPPSSLSAYLDDPASLVLDIRPHAAHAAARIHNALSLSVPTTLLKRPLFSLSKLSQMLPSPSSRARFANWSSASRILVYDSDSTSSPDNSIIAGLLRKFRAEGFTGELAWVPGGFQAIWREARHLATTDLPPPEEDDLDPASSSGTLRTSHLPKAAFSVFSTTAAPPPQLGSLALSYPLPNTPAPSASRVANPFFDAIRQNMELSHGITERIPLRLPRRVRRRIDDLPFRWLQNIAHRSAVKRTAVSRHPGLDSFESSSESGDDPHTSDPDEGDPHVEEGTEAFAMQFYRIELAEQRRLRSIMEHHTREFELAGIAHPTKPRRTFDKVGASIGAGPTNSGVSLRAGAKSVPGTPSPFPFSITAGVEKGTKNRYTHIWPFEHARVRLHDGRHQGSHPGRRDRGRASESGRDTRDRAEEKSNEREEQQDKQRRSCSSPAFGKNEDQEVPQVDCASKYFSGSPTTNITAGRDARLAHPTLSLGPSVPQVRIEYDVTEQDSRVSGPSTPATALPLPTPPFYTPMDISPMPTPLRGWPPQQITLPSGVSVSPGARLGGPPFFGSHPSFLLRLPNRSGGLLSSIGEHTWSSESVSSVAPRGGFPETGVEAGISMGTMRDLRREPSPADDYVNASYVQPLGTRKRYIATQGPLPSTYVDFWTLVWEQNVHVIVMLTREVENAMVKCGSYWTDTEYGPLRLELLSTFPPISAGASMTSTDISQQGFFAIREPHGKVSLASRDQPTMITRVFALSHTSYPGVLPRRITHLQYLDWSDMNVPDDPRGVLDLIRRVEQAVAESTPGPSPGGSWSPGSASGSLSGSQSPEIGSDQRTHDPSLLSPTTAGFAGGRRRRGNEWRHPELDVKTGIATFALGRAGPVLLHCSAGVGRTGGFIAVDAMLDGIRREMRRRREKGLEKASGTNVTNTEDTETGGELSLESTEAGVNSVESSSKESASDGNEHMDVDEPSIGRAEEVQDPLHGINTVPIHVSAGDRTRRHHHHKRPSGEKLHSSSESLVVHVPCVGSDDAPEDANVTSIHFGDTQEAGWQSSSTREWVEQVSDQTHVHAEEGNNVPPPSLPLSSRERSPGSTSSGSGPSALNSADESMNGSIDANASGSASGSVSGNKIEQKSSTGSASASGTGSRSGRPPPSLVSKQGSGSISFSNSGSGTGTGSGLGSSLLRARLRDSSVTSISAESTDSLSPKHEPKPRTSPHRPLAIGNCSSSDMDIDSLPRPLSAPLPPTHSNAVTPQRAAQSKPVLRSSPIAKISGPIFLAEHVTPSLGGDAASRLDSDPSSDTNPPQEFQSGKSADAEGSTKIGQGLSDKSEEPSKSRSNLRLDTKLDSLRIPDAMHSYSSAKSPPLPSRDSKGRERASITLPPRISDGSAPPAAGIIGTYEYDQQNMDHQVVDYKLPRELHDDLSPPLISSFEEPVCTVIQDMREQRMSLCQSLRQYVFVHAAIIEGALRIVDEERELWGSVGTSDDTSSAEEESEANIGDRGRQSGGNNEGSKARFGLTDKTEVAATTPELEHSNIHRRAHPLHIISQPRNHWTMEGGSQVPLAPTSSSSSLSSPSKGKRGPSPTELLREDKTGALSLNKRPIIQRQTITHEDHNRALFKPNGFSPVAGGSGGGLRDIAVGTDATQPTPPGLPEVPEKGGSTGSDWTSFE